MQKRSTAFVSFVCYLSTTEFRQDKSVSPQTYILRCLRYFSRKSLPPGCLPRLVITLGLCKARGSSRLDCTHSKDNAIALPAFCVPVPSPRRSSGVKMARFQFPFWHMLVPESLTMPSVQECGMLGAESTYKLHSGHSVNSSTITVVTLTADFLL